MEGRNKQRKNSDLELITKIQKCRSRSSMTNMILRVQRVKKTSVAIDMAM